jgi:predicted nucleic acid-binding protein
MYLLDTNVASELRKLDTGRADPGLAEWAEGLHDPDELYLSVITVEELEHGILLVERRDTEQGAILRSWITTPVLSEFADRILPVTTDVALRGAALHVADPRNPADALIAATALVHSLTVVTRNVPDFTGTGAAVLNPWSDATQP